MIGELAFELALVAAITVSMVGGAVFFHWFTEAWPLYRRFRLARVVVCPETGRAAHVTIDARRAAATALAPRPDLRLTSCSRWPERGGCGRECVERLDGAPSVRAIARLFARFYAGKSCVYCGRRFARIEAGDRGPALVGPDGRTVEWRDLLPEEIPQAIADDRVVCRSCHTTEDVRRGDVEPVGDRPWTPEEWNLRTH